MRIADLTSCFEKNADALTRFAATMVGSDDADDVVSDAIVGVLRSSPAHVDDMTAYLYRAVANAAKKHWRSLSRRERREHATAQTDLVDVAFADPAIAASLMALSPQQRAVVHLTYWEDLTPPMVAIRLGVSDGTVRRQLARARSRLSEVLDGHR